MPRVERAEECEIKAEIVGRKFSQTRYSEEKVTLIRKTSHLELRKLRRENFPTRTLIAVAAVAAVAAIYTDEPQNMPGLQ